MSRSYRKPYAGCGGYGGKPKTNNDLQIAARGFRHKVNQFVRVVGEELGDAMIPLRSECDWNDKYNWYSDGPSVMYFVGYAFHWSHEHGDECIADEEKYLAKLKRKQTINFGMTTIKTEINGRPFEIEVSDGIELSFSEGKLRITGPMMPTPYFYQYNQILQQRPIVIPTVFEPPYTITCSSDGMTNQPILRSVRHPKAQSIVYPSIAVAPEPPSSTPRVEGPFDAYRAVSQPAQEPQASIMGLMAQSPTFNERLSEGKHWMKHNMPDEWGKSRTTEMMSEGGRTFARGDVLLREDCD